MIEIIESEELNELCRLHAQGDPKGCFASKVTIKLKDGSVFTIRHANPNMPDDEMVGLGEIDPITCVVV